MSLCPGTKKFPCPGVPLSREKGRSKCPGTNPSVPGRPWTPWTKSPSKKNKKKQENNVLKQEKDVLKQKKDVLKQEKNYKTGNLVILLKSVLKISLNYNRG